MSKKRPDWGTSFAKSTQACEHCGKVIRRDERMAFDNRVSNPGLPHCLDCYAELSGKEIKTEAPKMVAGALSALHSKDKDWIQGCFVDIDKRLNVLEKDTSSMMERVKQLLKVTDLLALQLGQSERTNIFDDEWMCAGCGATAKSMCECPQIQGES